MSEVLVTLHQCEAVALAWKGRSVGKELGRKGEGSAEERMMEGEKRKKSIVGVINRVGVVGLSGRRNPVARVKGERKTEG